MAKQEPDATVDKREMSKGKAALLIFLSGLAAVFSSLELHGWHVYLGLAIVGVGLTIGFARWARK